MQSFLSGIKEDLWTLTPRIKVLILVPQPHTQKGRRPLGAHLFLCGVCCVL